jgi:hypothetical protein
LDAEATVKGLREQKIALQHKLIQDEEGLRMDKKLQKSGSMKAKNLATRLSALLIERNRTQAEKEDMERKLKLLEDSLSVSKKELKSQRDFYSSLDCEGETGSVNLTHLRASSEDSRSYGLQLKKTKSSHKIPSRARGHG